MEDVPCNLCGSGESEPLLTGPDRLYGIGGVYNLVRCTKCGLAYVNPRPDGKSLKHFYPEEYLVEGENLSAAAPDDRNAKAAMEFIGQAGGPGLLMKVFKPGRYLRLKRDYRLYSLMFTNGMGRLLDVGCGNGRFISMLKRMGWDAAGVEVNRHTIRHMAEREGLEVYVGNFLGLEIPGKFDVLTMWWFLEHTTDPLGVLKKAKGMLADGGNLVVAVQNFACVERRVFGKDWAPLDLPRHLYHFTPGTIEAMFREAGLR
ncbi:MAG TPA: class I SAM-dependent methyltransferase, partial [Nitrospirota bacterium]|nr:class I SAM-dependent methyltransferase [Nitrospirota bacterium]